VTPDEADAWLTEQGASVEEWHRTQDANRQAYGFRTNHRFDDIMATHAPPTDHLWWCWRDGWKEWEFFGRAQATIFALDELRARLADYELPAKSEPFTAPRFTAQQYPGRILVDYRCKKRGHQVAVVYSTSVGYVLISSAYPTTRREAEAMLGEKDSPSAGYYELLRSDGVHRVGGGTPRLVTGTNYDPSDGVILDWPSDTRSDHWRGARRWRAESQIAATCRCGSAGRLPLAADIAEQARVAELTRSMTRIFV